MIQFTVFGARSIAPPVYTLVLAEQCSALHANYPVPAELYMPAISDRVFRILPLQKQPGFPVTFLVQIMQQRRIRVARQSHCQFVNARKERTQIRFGIGRRHGFRSGIQFSERLEQILFQRRFHGAQ